jgi:hypothetical protein
MKKIILFFACLLLINEAYCQTPSDSTSKENFTKQYYFQKSKNQKTGAWALVIGGVLIFTATGIYASNNLNLNSPVKHRHVVPIGLSIACAAGSIPLFIDAGRNKLKAIKATTCFKMEKIPVLQQTTINFQSYPAISVKLNF